MFHQIRSIIFFRRYRLWKAFMNWMVNCCFLFCFLLFFVSLLFLCCFFVVFNKASLNIIFSFLFFLREREREFRPLTFFTIFYFSSSTFFFLDGGVYLQLLHTLSDINHQYYLFFFFFSPQKNPIDGQK